jgi:hypothetical protein
MQNTILSMTLTAGCAAVLRFGFVSVTPVAASAPLNMICLAHYVPAPAERTYCCTLIDAW